VFLFSVCLRPMSCVSNVGSVSGLSPVLVVEEAGENHRPWAGKQLVSLSVASRVHPFCNLQRGQSRKDNPDRR
jgi:hypothetical protein